MQTLEERKQQFREQLKIDFAPQKYNKFQLFTDETKYQSTSSIIRLYSSNNWPGQSLIVKENSLLLLGIFLIVAPLIAFASTYKERNYIIWILFVVFFCYGVKVINDSMHLKTKLIVDSNGIDYYEWPGYIKWQDIVATYIQEEVEGEYSNNWLLIFYHNLVNDSFEKKSISFSDLQTDVKEVCYFIEYLKKKAGFPTQSELYS